MTADEALQEIRRLATQNRLRYTRHARERMADPAVRIVDLSQMDCANPCECPACAAFDRRHGGPAASLIRMCNAVAARTSRDYPDKFVGTLAYTYSVRAPKGLKGPQCRVSTVPGFPAGSACRVPFRVRPAVP